MAEREMAWDRGLGIGGRALALRHPAAEPRGSHLHRQKPNGHALGVECEAIGEVSDAERRHPAPIAVHDRHTKGCEPGDEIIRHKLIILLPDLSATRLQIGRFYKRIRCTFDLRARQSRSTLGLTRIG